jgi:putative membrane protein
MKSINKLIICRSLVAASVLTALALRAEPLDSDRSKGDAASSATGSARSSDPATCIQEAAKMNAGTIRFAQLAQQKAENPQLKQFAQSLERDHQKAQTELQTIAKKHNVEIATGTEGLDAKCQQELTRLEGLSGAEFDKEFAKGAVEGHAMAAAQLQQASTQAKDPDIAQYTRNMLARIKQHQQQGRDIAKAVGVDEATITSIETKAQSSVGAPGQSTSESSNRSDSSKSNSSSDSTQRNQQTTPQDNK